MNKNPTVSNDVLSASLGLRQAKIADARQILEQTQHLFSQFGGEELKASHAKFAELERSLDADSKVLLVFVGEFSRGKSSLVNALLGIKLLRHAQEATTAINTFVRALPPGRTERFIRVHFVDGRPAQELAWTDASALERWSTELDQLNADARLTVDHIEVFMAHPLLEQGLVLIDTPGLESMVQHHEEITRRAIAEAHIAVWVQSAYQLGGNATEWKFVSGTIRKNFSKFITVVNMWDAILESRDQDSIGKTPQELSAEKLERVRVNFRTQLADQPAEELALMTDPDHLMGVSASWALSEDTDKRARSGVDRLAERLGNMFSSGEALEQIYLKPLKQLAHIQEQLLERIREELAQLNSADSLEQRARDLALFDEEIKNLDLEMRTLANESAIEHSRAARFLAGQIEQQLVLPLAELKAEIELQLTASYIETLIAKKARKIVLPPQLAKAFDDVTATVEQRWQEQKRRLNDSLEGLREHYAERMGRHADQLNSALGGIQIHLPKLDVGFELDLGPIEIHHAQALELEQQVAAHEKEISQLSITVQQHQPDREALEQARVALQQAEARIDRLGAQPSPRVGYRSEQVGKGGMYSGPRYEQREYLDDSNVQAWREDMARHQQKLADREQYMAELIRQEKENSGIVISAKAALAIYEKELSNFQRKQQAAERRHQEAQQELVQGMLDRLIAGTVGQLQQRIAYLQGHLAEAIQQLYDNQLQLLQACVAEQFMEPLNDKRAQRESVQQLIQQGQQEVAQRKQVLEQALQDMARLAQATADARR